jgi:ABC transport system ATP-binding/permease protein
VEGFPGTVILVSHDRDFLDRTVTSTIAPAGGGRWIEYAGGYSDMMAQRKDEALERRKARPVQESPVRHEARGEAPRVSTRKLSYKQKFALETLPGRIGALGGEIAKLEEKLADPALYSRDASAFSRFTEELDAKRAERERLEEEWLELEMLREEIEGG